MREVIAGPEFSAASADVSGDASFAILNETRGGLAQDAADYGSWRPKMRHEGAHLLRRALLLRQELYKPTQSGFAGLLGICPFHAFAQVVDVGVLTSDLLVVVAGHGTSCQGSFGASRSLSKVRMLQGQQM